MVRVPPPIAMMDRDEFLQMQREGTALSKPPLWSDARNELVAEQREDAEIAELRSHIVALQADIAVKEGELQALIIKTLAGKE
jgi:hypothetical protein